MVYLYLKPQSHCRIERIRPIVSSRIRPGTAAGISQSLILNGTMAYLASSENAGVAKLADAPDLGSGGEILRGSSPLSGKLLEIKALR
jgi:hypothetical protein